MINYSVLYATFCRRDAEKYMASHYYPNMVLWFTGSGVWEVRVRRLSNEHC